MCRPYVRYSTTKYSIVYMLFVSFFNGMFYLTYIGLNLSREIGTHFAQESLLKASCALSARLHLPIILHIHNAASLTRTIEILHSEEMLISSADTHADSSVVVVLHDAMTCCESQIQYVQAATKAGFYFSLAGTGLTEVNDSHTDLYQRSQACVAAIPADKLLLCTDSPWKTPQNLPDTYLRTLRNEPCNLISIAVSVSEALNIDIQVLSANIRRNTMKVLQLPSLIDSEEPIVTPIPETCKISPITKPKTHVDSTSMENKSQGFYSCARCRTAVFDMSDRRTHSGSSTASTVGKTVFSVGETGMCANTLMFAWSPVSTTTTTTTTANTTTADIANMNSSNNIDSSNTTTTTSEVHTTHTTSTAATVRLHGNTIECIECGSKLGKFSHTDALCGCGAHIPGT